MIALELGPRARSPAALEPLVDEEQIGPRDRGVVELGLADVCGIAAQPVDEAPHRRQRRLGA